MKLILTLGLLLGAAWAQADSFTIIRDGETYLCQSQGVIDPGGKLRCIEAAYRGPFTRAESEQICTGARDESPALCGIEAYSGPFSRSEAIGLCVGAPTKGPADCAKKAYSGPFTKEESLSLCRGGTMANADCAIKAYGGAYSREEALRLCKASPALVLRALNLLEQSSEIQEKMRSMRKE